jgi:hypothetical protein
MEYPLLSLSLSLSLSSPFPLLSSPLLSFPSLSYLLVPTKLLFLFPSFLSSLTLLTPV